MEEGADNVLRVDVLDTIAPDTEVNIFFRGQKFMHVACVDSSRVIPAVEAVASNSSPYVNANFNLPAYTPNTEITVKVTCDDVSNVVTVNTFSSSNSALLYNNDSPNGFAKEMALSLFADDKTKLQVNRQQQDWVPEGSLMVVDILSWKINGVPIYIKQNP